MTHTKHTKKTEPLKVKLLVEVTIEDVKNKYPNFRFNYESREDFLNNNIIPSLEHVVDEQEYDAGYETVVANGMLDCMETFIKVGDKVGFIIKSGYMGRESDLFVGKIIEISTRKKTEYVKEATLCKIQYTTRNGKTNSVVRNTEELLAIYDLLEEL